MFEKVSKNCQTQLLKLTAYDYLLNITAILFIERNSGDNVTIINVICLFAPVVDGIIYCDRHWWNEMILTDNAQEYRLCQVWASIIAFLGLNIKFLYMTSKNWNHNQPKKSFFDIINSIHRYDNGTPSIKWIGNWSSFDLFSDFQCIFYFLPYSSDSNFVKRFWHFYYSWRDAERERQSLSVMAWRRC